MSERGPGEVVAERFEIVGRLTSGAPGEAWTARDRARGGASVVLRVAAGDQDTVERFGEEAESFARLSSPYVAPLVAHGSGDGFAYAAFADVEAEPLEALLRRERLLGAVALRSVVEQMLEGLAAAHAVGVVHRNLKPSSVLLTDGVRGVKLVDFAFGQAVADTATLESLTYMAPEQIGASSGAADPRSDIYAAAMIAYRALGGRLPFSTEDAMAIIAAKSASAKPPALRDVTSMRWPDAIEEFFQIALAHDPGARFASASEARAVWSAAVAYLTSKKDADVDVNVDTDGTPSEEEEDRDDDTLMLPASGEDDE